MSEVITRRPTRALQRVAASDFSVAEEVLKTAALLIVPEDQTQRQAFEKLMPHLYVLRNKGCSWPQLAKLLGECGFNLQPSTVRSYFSEMLAARMDVCQARMNEQIALMAAVRSETAGADISAISGRVNAVLERLQSSAAPKVDALFGPATSSRAIEPPQRTSAVSAGPRPVEHVSQARPRAVAQTPAPTVESHDDQTDSPNGEFGLLGLSGPSEHSPSGPAGFFTLDTPAAPAPSPAPAEREPDRIQAKAPKPAQTASAAPQRPSAAAPRTSVASAPTHNAIKKRASPLQDGVPALKRRDNVPASVYEPGELEHPAIPGLMLNLEQRLYGAALEYFDGEGDEAGVIKVETADEKRFRVVWRQTVPITPTRTAESFTKMDPSLFSPGS